MEERINSIINKLEKIPTKGLDTILMAQALTELITLRDRKEDEDDNDKD